MSARQPWSDGALAVVLRSAQATDRNKVAQFLSRMDREGLYQRNFSHGEAPNLALLDRIDILDQADRFAVLAFGANGDVLGHGEYVAEIGEAEFAFMVLPMFRGLGIGARLLQALLAKGRMAGQRRLHGMIQASNATALRLVLDHGFRVVPGDDRRVVIVSCDLQADFDPDRGRQITATLRRPALLISNDPDRTPLHCRTGPRAPLWPRGGQVQRLPADTLGGGKEA